MFKLIPKQYLYIGLLLAGTALTTLIYHKGYQSGSNSVEVRVAKERAAEAESYDEFLDEELKAANIELREALEARKEGLEIITKLKVQLEGSRTQNQSIQEEALRNAVNKQDDSCSVLSAEYYELYKQLYNTAPPESQPVSQ